MTQLYCNRVLCAVRVTLCVSGVVRAVHQSSSKLGDTPLVRLDLFELLPSRRGLTVEPLQQTLQQNRALHRSTGDSHRPAADVELYSSTALYTLHPLHPPSARTLLLNRLLTSAGEQRQLPLWRRVLCPKVGAQASGWVWRGAIFMCLLVHRLRWSAATPSGRRHALRRQRLLCPSLR